MSPNATATGGCAGHQLDGQSRRQPDDDAHDHEPAGRHLREPGPSQQGMDPATVGPRSPRPAREEESRLDQHQADAHAEPENRAHQTLPAWRPCTSIPTRSKRSGRGGIPLILRSSPP